MKGKRRTFTEEFKQESSRLVLESGKSTRQIANELGIGEALLGRWVKNYQAQGGSEGLSPAEREELERLRKEVKRLEMERDILKKATAFFVKEQQ